MYSENSNNMFINAYLYCALWSSMNDNGEPLDKNYDICDFDHDSLEKLKAHALKFFTDNIKLINSAENYSYDQAGHDLWLTENGHGSGFWDGDINQELGNKLTELSENHETDIYVGDDNKLYI